MVLFQPYAACWRFLDLQSRRWQCCSEYPEILRHGFHQAPPQLHPCPCSQSPLPPQKFLWSGLEPDQITLYGPTPKLGLTPHFASEGRRLASSTAGGFSFLFSWDTKKSRMWFSPRGCLRGVKHCWPLLGCVEVNMGDVREEGNRSQIVDRARQEIFLTAVFFHQRVSLTRVKEDLIRSHQQDTWNHTLMQKTTEVSPVKGNNTGLEDSEGLSHPPYGLWCSGRAVWGTEQPLVPHPHRIQVAEPTSRAVRQASVPPPHPVNMSIFTDKLTSWTVLIQKIVMLPLVFGKIISF